MHTEKNKLRVKRREQIELIISKAIVHQLHARWVHEIRSETHIQIACSATSLERGRVGKERIFLRDVGILMRYDRYSFMFFHVDLH